MVLRLSPAGGARADDAVLAGALWVVLVFGALVLHAAWFSVAEFLPDLVDVRMRGDQCLASREGKVQLTDDFDEVVDGFFIADIDQNPLIGVVNQIDIAAKDFTGLEIQFDDAGEDRFSSNHDER